MAGIHCGQQTLAVPLQGFDQPKRDVETFLRFPQARAGVTVRNQGVDASDALDSQQIHRILTFPSTVENVGKCWKDAGSVTFESHEETNRSGSYQKWLPSTFCTFLPYRIRCVWACFHMRWLFVQPSLKCWRHYGWNPQKDRQLGLPSAGRCQVFARALVSRARAYIDERGPLDALSDRAWSWWTWIISDSQDQHSQ